MRYALSRIAGMVKDTLVARVTTDECRVVDGIEYLPRPAVRDVSKLGQQSPHPRFDPLKPRPGIVCFAGLVIGAADDHVLGGAATVLTVRPQGLFKTR